MARTYQHGTEHVGTVCEGYNVAGRWVDCDRPMPHYHGIMADMGICPFEGTTADECAMIRERSVAGISNDIPACPVHGAYPAEAEA